jgi:hypothetical protein
MASILTRIKSNIDVIGDCWIWKLSKFPNGYGQIKIKGQPTGAHVASYLAHGFTIPKGLHLRHTCNNKPCVRPDHLIPGTALQNADDRRKVDPNYGKIDLQEAIRLTQKGYSQKIIGKHFGVSQGSVSNLLRRHGVFYDQSTKTPISTSRC